LVRFSVTHPAGIPKASRAGGFENPGRSGMKAQPISQDVLIEKYAKMAKLRRKKSFGE
jgi:hypothetical protein